MYVFDYLCVYLSKPLCRNVLVPATQVLKGPECGSSEALHWFTYHMAGTWLTTRGHWGEGARTYEGVGNPSLSLNEMKTDAVDTHIQILTLI